MDPIAYLNSLPDNQQALSAFAQSPKKKKKNFWVDQISTAGGIGGGILGSFVTPIAGTAGGAALGSSLGEALENALTHESIGKNVLKEGLIGGALGVGPGRLLKGGLALKGGTKTVEAGSALQRGVANTTKVADTFTNEQKVLEAIKRNGLKGSGQNMYKNVDLALQKLGSQIDAHLAQSTASTARKPLVNGLRKAVADTVPADSAYTRELNRALSRIEKSASAKVNAQELFNMKKEVGNRLNNAFTKLDRGNPLTTKEEVDMALWRNLDEAITKIEPKVKQLTLDQSALITARPGLKASANKSVGIPLLGIKSTGAERFVQASKNKAGQVLSNATDVKPITAKGVAARVGGVGLVRGMGNLAPITPTDESAQAPSLEDQLVNSPDYNAPSTSPGIPKDTFLQAMLQDLQLTGGKNIDKIKAVYEFASPENGQKPLNSTQQQQANNANSALGDISVIAQMLQQDPSLTYKEAIPGGSIARRLTGTTDYDASRKNIADVISRMRTGAAINAHEEKLYMSLLPAAGDSQESAMRKLQRLAGLFQSFANPQGAGTSLEDVLAGLQSSPTNVY